MNIINICEDVVDYEVTKDCTDYSLNADKLVITAHTLSIDKNTHTSKHTEQSRKISEEDARTLLNMQDEGQRLSYVLKHWHVWK